MPQLDINTIINQFIIILIILVPALIFFRICIYPSLDLLLRTRIYRYNNLTKSVKFFSITILKLFFEITIKSYKLNKHLIKFYLTKFPLK